MNSEEARRCEHWRALLQHEFPTLVFHFWKNENGGYLVRVRRSLQGYPSSRAGEEVYAETFPTLFIGQWPSPEFITKCAIIA